MDNGGNNTCSVFGRLRRKRDVKYEEEEFKKHFY